LQNFEVFSPAIIAIIMIVLLFFENSSNKVTK